MQPVSKDNSENQTLESAGSLEMQHRVNFITLSANLEKAQFVNATHVPRNLIKLNLNSAELIKCRSESKKQLYALRIICKKLLTD